MSTKKTKKPARSVRYLLSANSRLQRISLKKLSANDKSAKKRPRAAAMKDSGRPQETGEPKLKESAEPKPSSSPSLNPSWAISSRAIAITAVGVTVFAVLMATRQPASPVDAAKVQAQPGPLEVATAGARLDTRQTIPPAAPAVTVETSTRLAATPAAVKPAVTPPLKASTVEAPSKASAESVAKAPAVESTAKAPATAAPAKSPVTEPAAAAESAVKAPPAEPTAKPEAQSAAAITITGCLEANDEKAYRLTDTVGEETPKSRSWKSGFLKKRSSNVDIVDAGHTLDLEHHVGQRVAATGTLTNHEMKAHSLRRVAAKCS